MMKPHVLARVSREVAFGLHELLKTNAANIHCTDDWYTLFSLLECIGGGVKPPASFQLASSTDNDTGSPLLHHCLPFRSQLAMLVMTSLTLLSPELLLNGCFLWFFMGGEQVELPL